MIDNMNLFARLLLGMLFESLINPGLKKLKYSMDPNKRYAREIIRLAIAGLIACQADAALRVSYGSFADVVMFVIGMVWVQESNRHR